MVFEDFVHGFYDSLLVLYLWSATSSVYRSSLWSSRILYIFGLVFLCFQEHCIVSIP